MIEQTLALDFLGCEQTAGTVEKMGNAQADAANGDGAVKSKKPRKPRSETNRENYLKRMSRDMPVKLWLSPESFEVFEAGRKAKKKSRSQYGNELFGKHSASPNQDDDMVVDGSARGIPENSSAAQVNETGSTPAALLSDRGRKKLSLLARYSRGGGRQLSESEVLNSLLEGVSSEMLVWMLKISNQQDQSLVEVLRTQLSLAKVEHSKNGAAAVDGRRS